jgi:membrane dipeptidase
MNRLGVIVDVSHVSDDTFWDVMEVSASPVIASHSNARALLDSPRNLSDEMIRAVGAKDGVVMINFMTVYLDPEKASFWKVGLGWHWFWHPGGTETPLSVVVDHIDHVVSLVGIDHVGIGSDFDGAPFLPAGLEDVADLPNLTAELLRRGYSDGDTRKVLGANTLRVLAAAEQTGLRLLTSTVNEMGVADSQR